MLLAPASSSHVIVGFMNANNAPGIARACAALLASLVLGLTFAGCQPQADNEAASADAAGGAPPSAAPSAAPSASSGSRVSAAADQPLKPLPGRENTAPPLTQSTRISMQTTAGEILIEVYPEAAPNAAKRFVELVEAGFYDDTPISRVVPGFVAQFGVNWREPHNEWKDRNFDDDPSAFALDRGTLAFAKAGPNSNSTQVFINYSQNNRLADPSYNFTTFGKVVSGMEAVDAFVQVGDPGGGLDQERLWTDGGAYLESLTVKPTMIERVTVID
jgi:cyclophilin family peptidyl-prolyl cis-trans isomerase